MLFTVLLVLLTLPVQQPPATEKPVDPQSARVSLLGCLRGRNLVTIEPSEHEPVNVTMAPGRVFRLKASKELMNDLKKRDKTVIAVTGLVRKSALDPGQQGIPVAGGRVRVGVAQGQNPSSPDMRRDPFASMEVMDVESFRPADGVCPTKK